MLALRSCGMGGVRGALAAFSWSLVVTVTRRYSLLQVGAQKGSVRVVRLESFSARQARRDANGDPESMETSLLPALASIWLQPVATLT